MPFNFTKRLFEPKGDLIGAPSGELMPTGLIGPWSAYRMRSLYVTEDVKLFNADVSAEARVPYDDFTARGDGSWLYYLDDADCEAKAKIAVDAFDLTDPSGSRPASPGRVWRFRISRNDVISFSSQESREKWGDAEGVIAFDVPVRGHTKRAWKSRHEYQLIALPSAVAAAARYMDEADAIYDLSELLSDDAVFTDEFHHLVVGGRDENDAWTESILGQRRAELWKVLDENDVKVYNPFGIGAKKYQAKEGSALDECLKVASAQWPQPLWCKVMQVPNPRSDAVSGQGNRLNIPAIFEFYANRKEAQAALDAERAEFGADGTDSDAVTAATAETASHPPLPADWEQVGVDEWVNELKQNDKPAPLAAKELSATVADVNAWRGYLGI